MGLVQARPRPGSSVLGEVCMLGLGWWEADGPRSPEEGLHRSISCPVACAVLPSSLPDRELAERWATFPLGPVVLGGGGTDTAQYACSVTLPRGQGDSACPQEAPGFPPGYRGLSSSAGAAWQSTMGSEQHRLMFSVLS